jgi:hypothetical protein
LLPVAAAGQVIFFTIGYMLRLNKQAAESSWPGLPG